MLDQGKSRLEGTLGLLISWFEDVQIYSTIIKRIGRSYGRLEKHSEGSLKWVLNISQPNFCGFLYNELMEKLVPDIRERSNS